MLGHSLASSSPLVGGGASLRHGKTPSSSPTTATHKTFIPLSICSKNSENLWSSFEGSKMRGQSQSQQRLLVLCNSSSSSDNSSSGRSNQWDKNDGDYVEAHVVDTELLKHQQLRKQGLSGASGLWHSSDQLTTPINEAKESEADQISLIEHGLLRRFRNPTIFLRIACDGNLLLPIIVGEFAIGKLIDALHEDEKGGRPNPFQLMRDLVGTLGYEVRMIRITERVVNTYYARIYIGKPGEKVMLSVDARPSDAINLAKRCKVPKASPSISIHPPAPAGFPDDQSAQHVMLDRFDLSNPDATFDQPLVFPLSKYVFGLPNRPDIIHRCVMFERSLMRSGSANTKTRSELAMSGRKLRPQKGTGKARLGDASSPTLRKGAAAFGPKPKDWAQGIPRKVWELGLRTILSQRWREGRLFVVDRFNMNDNEYGSEELAQLIKRKHWSDAMFIAGGDWGTAETGWSDAGRLRQALGREHMISPGIRLGQTGSWWTQQQKAKILPLLNKVDLAHPHDFQPGKPHTNDWKPGRVGVYHLLLRKNCIMDIEAVKYLENKLTWDLRRPIGALGISPEESSLQQSLALDSLAGLI